MLTARLSLALAGTLIACAPSRPKFVEPDWGDAPPPYAFEVTEITLDTRTCPALGPKCIDERIVLQRDGLARKEIREPGKGVDSLWFGRIDSLTFIRLVGELRQQRLFTGSPLPSTHEPLAVTSFIASGATLCRRATKAYRIGIGEAIAPPVPGIIQIAAGGITWQRCCGFLHVGEKVE